MQVNVLCESGACNDASIAFGFAESTSLYVCLPDQSIIALCLAYMLCLICPLFFLWLLAVSKSKKIFDFLAQQQSRLSTWYNFLTYLDPL